MILLNLKYDYLFYFFRWNVKGVYCRENNKNAQSDPNLKIGLAVIFGVVNKMGPQGTDLDMKNDKLLLIIWTLSPGLLKTQHLH